MMRNRKVWGVLGLLLALVVVVGYGQGQQPQKPTTWLLTTVQSRVPMAPIASTKSLELFITGLDIHPDYNLAYQVNQKCENRQGIGLFLPGFAEDNDYATGSIQVLIPAVSDATTSSKYKFKARFCKPWYSDPNYPHAVGVEPQMKVQAYFDGSPLPPGSWVEPTTCADFEIDRVITDHQPHNVKWDFKLKQAAAFFCRVEVTR